MQWFWGEVYAKTPGLYQVPNWSYGQKTQKRGELGGLRGVRGVQGWWGGAGEMQWRCRGSGGGLRENPRSLSSP